MVRFVSRLTPGSADLSVTRMLRFTRMSTLARLPGSSGSGSSPNHAAGNDVSEVQMRVSFLTERLISHGMRSERASG